MKQPWNLDEVDEVDEVEEIGTGTEKAEAEKVGEVGINKGSFPHSTFKYLN